MASPSPFRLYRQGLRTCRSYWDVIGVKIDDGHFADYADFLVNKARRQNEFAKSKGWFKADYVLSNNNTRKDEPAHYLITVTDRMPIRPSRSLETRK